MKRKSLEYVYNNIGKRICAVEGCDRPHRFYGYCNAHGQQVYHHGRITSIKLNRDLGAYYIRNEHGEKQCVRCEEWSHLDNFSSGGNRKDGKHTECKKCESCYRHGITRPIYDRAFIEQKGVCKICGSAGPLQIDHDHSCHKNKMGCPECFRGLICRPCNSTLGHSRDSIDRLRKAAIYIEEWNTKKSDHGQ